MNRITAGCVLAAALVALAGCGSDEEASPTTTTTTTTAESTATPPSGPVTIRITVRGGRPLGGIARPTVDRGERVVLLVRADVSDHVHLHGYNRFADVAPGRPARLRFRATVPGRFEVELEDRRIPIAELTVRA